MSCPLAIVRPSRTKVMDRTMGRTVMDNVEPVQSVPYRSAGVGGDRCPHVSSYQVRPSRSIKAIDADGPQVLAA